MRAAEALKAARAACVSVGIDGDDLVLQASAPPPPAVLDALSRHKAAIVALLRPPNDGWTAENWQALFDTRAGIAEFNGGLSRAKAEAQAFAGCATEWLNRHPVRSAPGRCLGCGGGDHAHRQYSATVAGLIGIGPKDELEGMIAAQMLAAHNAAMECYRRAMLKDQPFEGYRENLNQANKLSRTYALLLDALNRHRGKGQQKVTVDHVHVHSGGQAVVGMVETPGAGSQPKSEEKVDAKQITNASQPTMRSPNADGEPVPVARDAERPMPDARGTIPRGSEGQQERP